MSKYCICPLCHHEETIRVRRFGEGIYDDPAMMSWQGPLGGARAACISRLDHGFWKCWRCGMVLTAHEAGVFLDAALYASYPGCDSIGDDGIHADAKIAFAGGRDND